MQYRTRRNDPVNRWRPQVLMVLRRPHKPVLRQRGIVIHAQRAVKSGRAQPSPPSPTNRPGDLPEPLELRRFAVPTPDSRRCGLQDPLTLLTLAFDGWFEAVGCATMSI